MSGQGPTFILRQMEEPEPAKRSPERSRPGAVTDSTSGATEVATFVTVLIILFGVVAIFLVRGRSTPTFRSRTAGTS